MAEGKNLIGVDIGSSSIKVCQLKESRKGYGLLRLGFTEEAETTANQKIPDPDAMDGTQETEKPKKRWRIQLAVSERASGKWQAQHAHQSIAD